MPRPPACVCALALGSAVFGGCLTDSSPNIGVRPPTDRIVFPAGLLVDPDPARAIDGRPRWLFVANGNSDLKFNAGSLLAIDLEAFWAAWYDDTLRGAYPYCDSAGAIDRCVLPPATPITAQRPCRRLAIHPAVVECDERPFVNDDATVRVGDFATVIAASRESDAVGEFFRLWIPVRGDPSITFVDVRGSGDALEMDCGQGSDPLDDRQCGDSFRLEHVRNDDDLPPLSREPFNVLVSESPGQRDRFAIVAHADGPALTVVDLEGVLGEPRPAIVDQRAAFVDLAGTGVGGFGLAQRPCFAAGEGPLGAADPQPNVPAVTEGCTRPLFYASYRYTQFLTSFTASGVRPPATAEVIDDVSRTDCYADLPVRCMGDLGCDAAAGACAVEPCERVYAGQYCATPDQIGQPCAVLCDPQVRARRVMTAIGGLIGDTTFSIPRLGDVAFGDARGDELWIVQTNPGALLRFDTSLDDNAVPRDIPSAPPIEICAEPTRMVIYDDEGRRFALVTCFAAAELFIVDLDVGAVIDDPVVVGTGPHDLVIDYGRRAAYVANTLEASVSVIDLARDRPTRFEEIARIGLQEPFSR